VHDPATLGRSGGPIHGDMTGTEWYATIYAFNESPITRGVLWAGSDDGLLHVSRDGGANWENVTPKTFGRFTRTAVIEPSYFDAGSAYVAANRYQQDDFKPYLWKTSDYGKSWTLLTNGIPTGAYTRTIREDPVRRGILYAGTETGVYVSFDDGANWQTLQLNLPRVSVRDLNVHQNDLVAATHGRAFWVMDDMSLLRSVADSVTSKTVFLFQPSKVVRWQGGRFRSLLAGENRMGGAHIDYYLKEKSAKKGTMEFLDQAGKVIRSFSSALVAEDSTKKMPNDSLAKAAREGRADSLHFEAADSIVSLRAGTNRFVWDMRYPGAKSIKNTVLDEGFLEGPVAPPGQYAVRLVLGKDTLTKRFEIVSDPRVKTPTAELVAQFETALRTRDRITEVAEAAVRVEDIQSQLDARAKQTKDQAFGKRVGDAAKEVRKKLESVRAELFEIGCHVDQCTLDQPIRLYNMLITLNMQVQTGDYGPTKQHGEIYTDLSGKVMEQLRKLQQIEDTDLAAFNKLLDELKIPGVFVPAKKIAS
jgi:hypothetical protein